MLVSVTIELQFESHETSLTGDDAAKFLADCKDSALIARTLITYGGPETEMLAPSVIHVIDPEVIEN